MIRWASLLLLFWTAAVAWADPVEVALFEGGEGLEFFQRCARELGGVEVYGDPRISEKLRIRLLESKPPEVTNANLPYEQLIAKGKLLELDRWLDGPNWEGTGRWRDDFLPGSLDRFVSGGKTYGIPLPYTVHAVYYDRRRFRENGWKPPHSWEEWVRLCELVRARGQAPLAFQGRYTYYATPLLHHAYYHLAGRQAYLDQLALQPGSFANPAMVEALRLVQELAQKQFQPGSLGMSHTEAQLEFLQGRAAMLVCGSWFKSEMRDKIPPGFELGEFAIPLPGGRSADPNAVQVGAGYFFVFRESRKPGQGVDYLRYITSQRQARQLVEAQDLPVAVVGANLGLSPDLGELAQMLERSRSSFGEGMTATHPGMVQVWSDVRFDLLHAKATPAELAERLESAAARLLRESADPTRVESLFPWRPWILAGLACGLALLGRAAPPWLNPLRRLPRRDWLLLAVPPLAIYGCFFLLPSLLALGAALTEWDGLGAPTWSGLLNFRRLLWGSERFWLALGNNLFLMACVPLMITLWSMLFAGLLQKDLPRHQLLRALYFFPHLLGIGSILVWQQLYHPQGPLNRLLVALGMDGFADYAWLSQDHLYPSLLPLALWSAGGFQLVLTSAAMSQVPEDLYEAARLDGASGWDSFWAVTWPHLRPTILAGYFLLLISAVKSFETVWLLTNQEPTSQTHVLGTLLMQTAFAELRLGEASALAVILLVLVLALQSALSRWEEVE
jgi:ABC-type sugar transport system permease subunit/ABC-type glycerol-3-phosphate transport system substrate-binding protein